MRLIVIGLFCVFTQQLFSQSEYSVDSIVVNNLLLKYNIKIDCDAAVNVSGEQLNISKKQFKKISKTIIGGSYGRIKLLNQRPFMINYCKCVWIARGRTCKRRKGGQVILIMNSKNGEIVLLTHGK